ncbi:MAG TPA: T9SS type A sorting domain-containing protein [Bacteroidales bacterium]|nr:T9SS type A sorting domain-containing protein [Bacteroidales bacterium]
MNIILLPTDRNNPQAGSTIYIDDLTFEYAQSIGENNNSAKLFSDHDANLIKLNFAEATDATIVLSDINGRTLKKIHASGIEASIGMAGIPKGVYIVHISDRSNIYSIKTIW